MLVSLVCLHIMKFNPPPNPGDDLWCTTCVDYRQYLCSAEPTTYRIRCTKCKYPRAFGNDKQAAFRAAIKHLTRQPTHRVRVTRNGELVQELTDATEPLPGVSEWLSQHPEHQGSLRELVLTKQTQPTSRGITPSRSGKV